MRCEEIQNKLALYLDNELSENARAEIEQHLLACSACAQELEILASINAIGKVNTFAEPDQKYWKQLRQNIMQQITEPEARPSWIFEGLTKLKRFLWPAKISYRLVGLAATATIAFFIVRISVIRHEKIEAPIQLGVRDSVEMAAPNNLVAITQEDRELETEIPAEKRAPKISQSYQDKDAGLLKARPSESIAKIPSPAISDQNKKLAASTTSVEMTTDQALNTQPPSIEALNQPAQPAEELRLDQAQAREIPDRAKFEKTHFQLNAVSKQFTPSEVDSSLNQFNMTSQQAGAMPELIKKIDTWEEYLQTNPEIKFAHQASCELALLYYDLAHENPTPENIHQALAFYSENVQLLFSTPDSLKFKKLFEELRSLGKK